MRILGGEVNYCTCGQEKSGYCTIRWKITGQAGILSQESNALLQCGKTKQQIKALGHIIMEQQR